MADQSLQIDLQLLKFALTVTFPGLFVEEVDNTRRLIRLDREWILLAACVVLLTCWQSSLCLSQERRGQDTEQIADQAGAFMSTD